MEILLVTREFPPFVLGGVAYHSYYLARSLIALGHNVTILTSDHCYSNKDFSMFNLENLNIQKIRYYNLPAPRIWFNEAVKRYLANHCFVNKFDIIHSHEYIDFKEINNNKNVILKIHTNLNEKPKYILKDMPCGFKQYIAYNLSNFFLWPMEQKLELKSLKSSSIRIYISQLAKNTYEQYYNFNDCNYNIIYNGVDTDLFNIKHEKNELNSHNEKYFLFVGSTEYRKGFDIICTCLNEINTKSNNIKIKVVGQFNSNNPHFKKMEYLNKIEFVGRTDQQKLMNLYQNAIALIHPARYEPFGNVVLESLACGTPVIISNEKYCGAAEILNNNCGIKINPHEPTELADAMQYILDNPEQFKSENCRKLAEKYTWGKVAKETIEFFNKSRG